MVTQAAFLQWLGDYFSENKIEQGKSLKLDEPLAAYGMDSVDVITLAFEFEDHFGVTAEPGLFLGAETLRDAIARLREHGVICD
jgi:acyl carrier protein